MSGTGEGQTEREVQSEGAGVQARWGASDDHLFLVHASSEQTHGNGAVGIGLGYVGKLVGLCRKQLLTSG